jgi:hypothetical protein
MSRGQRGRSPTAVKLLFLSSSSSFYSNQNVNQYSCELSECVQLSRDILRTAQMCGGHVLKYMKWNKGNYPAVTLSLDVYEHKITR